jgi:preprotein translocase subunit YajC
MQLLFTILMTGQGSQPGAPNPLFSFAMIGGMFLIFWLFMIRPQAKKAKEQKSYIDNLQKGEKVVTLAGIHGRINKVNEDTTFQIEVSPGSYLTIEKSAISQEWSAAQNKDKKA